MHDQWLEYASGPRDITSGGEFRFSDGVLDAGSDAPVIETAGWTSATVAADPEPSPAEAPEITGYTAANATSRDGGITVSTTEHGGLLGVHVDSDQLRRNPDELAHDILRLCRQAAGRAGAARRIELAKLGLPDYAIDLLGLPRPENVEHAELDAELGYEYEPRSWFGVDGRLW